MREPGDAGGEMTDRETLEERMLERHTEAGWGDAKGTICSCGDDRPCPEEADIRSLLERLEAAENDVVMWREANEKSATEREQYKAEVERLWSRLSDHKDAISQRDEIIRAQKEENERLRAALNETNERWERACSDLEAKVERLKRQYAHSHGFKQDVRIEAALAIGEPLVEGLHYRNLPVEEMVKALKGEGE